MIRGSLAERLDAYSIPEPNTGCLLWLGSRQKRSGYGQIQTRTGSKLAHRVSKEESGCSVPVGSVVRHTCDTPACINPNHLIVGTQRENIADRDAKGRQSKGTQVYSAKLSVLLVRQARQESWSIEKLQAKRGVSYRAAKEALRGASWRHVA